MVMDGGGHPESKMRFLPAKVSVFSVKGPALCHLGLLFWLTEFQSLYVLATVRESFDTNGCSSALLCWLF